MTRTCSTCPSTISARNRSGLCRPCIARRNATDPVMIAKRREGMMRMLADPVQRAAHIARLSENGKKISDAERARRVARGHTLAHQLKGYNARMSAETRAENGRKRSATVLAWCPPEWRDKYREIKLKGRKAAEAKRIVLDLIAGKPMPVLYAQQKSRLDWCPPDRLKEYQKARSILGAAEARRQIEADLTQFERMMARVAAGGKLIAVRPMPSRRYDFTLGGVATGQL